MNKTLYVVIVLDNNEPYVWADYLSIDDANCSAMEAAHETGFNCIVRTVNI
tara:strand:+ start:449 stop:601 length:153 start_codon:yes stop_codon:yes gene_type:complete